ncbi:MAG TPA: MEDS domain-containing protein [Terriglobia bacterium]|nr:MEDS domain-containing protein [Terriglobia bacterium]
MPALLTMLEGRFPIARHEHVAALYRGREGAFRFVAFLNEGLAGGELCCCVGTEEYQSELLARLRNLRPDVDDFLATRQLTLDRGAPDAKAMRDHLQGVFARAEKSRAPALRWLEEAGWAGATGLPQARYFEFHALLNFQVKHYPGAAICQFALDTLDPPTLCAAIAVHRHLIIENTFVRDNPFYVPPEKYLSLYEKDRHHEVEKAFRDVGFDTDKLLAALQGYGRLHPGSGI